MEFTKSPAFSRILPFAVFIAFLVIVDLISKYPISGFDVRWVYPVQSLAAILCVVYFWSSYTEFKQVESNRRLDWLLTIAVGVAVFAIWITLTQSWATIGEAKSYNPYVTSDGSGKQELDWALLFLRLAGSALVVPVIEELFWRSFLMRWIDQSNFLSLKACQVSLRAFMITAVLFALEHSFWFSGLLAGLAYNWLYWRTGNLWMVICAHAITNGVLGIWVIWTQQWQFW